MYVVLCGFNVVNSTLKLNGNGGGGGDESEQSSIKALDPFLHSILTTKTMIKCAEVSVFHHFPVYFHFHNETSQI